LGHLAESRQPAPRPRSAGACRAGRRSPPTPPPGARSIAHPDIARGSRHRGSW